MSNLEWRDRLLHELKKRNLPDSYSARFIEELTDHCTDIQKEKASMDAVVSVEQIIGTPESLAAAAEVEFRRRSFAGRHPFVVFALLPVPVTLLTVVVMAFTFVCPLEWILDYCRFDIPAPFGSQSKIAIDAVVQSFSLLTIRFAPFIIVSWLFIRVSLRTNNPMWGMIACILVSYFAFVHRVVYVPSWQTIRVGIGFEYGLHQWENGLVQMLIPALMGVWAWRKHETWDRICKLSLVLVPIFPIACAIPLNSRTGKMMATSVLVALTVTAVSGVIVCTINDRFRPRMSQA